MNKQLQSLRFLPEVAVYDEMDSPIGILTIITSNRGVHAVLWDNSFKNTNGESIMNNITRAIDDAIITKVKRQLDEYFLGKRKIFDLPLSIKATDFQTQAWKELSNIPYATTISYGEQAKRVGWRNKARAVGMANGLNPIGIIIPCHRVVGSNGNLVGFGGGLERKEWLLNHEKSHKNV